MSESAELNLEITSDPGELAQVREAIRKWAIVQQWSDTEVADIVLAADEALSNVIRHGYDGEPGHPIEIHVRALADDRVGSGLEIVVRDYGKQVPLDQICGRDLDDIRPGGLGVHIIHSVMSEVKYEHAPGGGMRLVMRKYRASTSASPDARPEEP